MKRWTRHVRRALAAFPQAPGELPAFWRTRRRQLVSAATLVRAFYACLFFILIGFYDSWDRWLRLTSLELLWPVWWFKWTGIKTGTTIVIFGAPLTALAALVWPYVRLARAAAALGILLFTAFFNSFGIIMHGLHGWLWVAALFVLLPDGPVERIGASTCRSQRYLRVFWSAQATLLLFYSMSGMMKIAAAVEQWSLGQVHALAPEALARHTAYRLLEGAEVSPFTVGPWIVHHPWAGYPFFLTAIFLETFSFLVAFRPALQRYWALGLILMQIGIFFTLTIMFTWHILVVALIVMCSPFAPSTSSFHAVLRHFPIIGDAMAWRERRHAR